MDLSRSWIPSISSFTTDLLLIRMCGCDSINIFLAKSPNPLKTEITIIKAATPIVIPSADRIEIIEIKFNLFFVLKYFFAMKNSNILIKFNGFNWFYFGSNNTWN